MTDTKRLGRPTKYEPGMCQRVIDLMSEGASKTEVAADLNIARDTLSVWQKDNDDFSAAIKRGEELSQAWWEREGRTSLRDKEFNHGLWYMNMKNRFGWKDRQEQENRFTDKHGNDVALPALTLNDKDIIERYQTQGTSVKPTEGKQS